MTDAQITQLARKVVSEMSERGMAQAFHYLHLEASQPHRPDYGLFIRALASSPTYDELTWALSDNELVQIDVAVMRLLRGGR